MRKLGSQRCRVLRVEGDYAVVLKERIDPCILCPGEDECSELERHDCGLEVRARNLAAARPGDWIELHLEGDGQLLRAILHVYGVPLVFLLFGLGFGTLAGASAGIALPLQGLAGFLGMALGLGLSFPVARRLDQRALESGEFTPIVSKVVEDGHAIEV